MDHAVGEAKRRRLSAVRLYTNAAMTENLSMYAHMGFVETHRAAEKGFNRVYLRWTLPGGAPLTTKLAPGSVWNSAASEGSLIQSCAHASLARQTSTAP